MVILLFKLPELVPNECVLNDRGRPLKAEGQVVESKQNYSI